jgi:transcriptional regulator with XRE-family HTH domain
MRKVNDVRINLQPLIEKKSLQLFGRKDALSQKDISEATKIPQGTLSRWMNGKVDSYKGDIIAALMTYFQCELEDLFIVESEEIAE